jgi:hypothetical protein
MNNEEMLYNELVSGKIGNKKFLDYFLKNTKNFEYKFFEGFWDKPFNEKIDIKEYHFSLDIIGTYKEDSRFKLMLRTFLKNVYHDDLEKESNFYKTSDLGFFFSNLGFFLNSKGGVDIYQPDTVQKFYTGEHVKLEHFPVFGHMQNLIKDLTIK